MVEPAEALDMAANRHQQQQKAESLQVILLLAAARRGGGGSHTWRAGNCDYCGRSVRSSGEMQRTLASKLDVAISRQLLRGFVGNGGVQERQVDTGISTRPEAQLITRLTQASVKCTCGACQRLAGHCWERCGEARRKRPLPAVSRTPPKKRRGTRDGLDQAGGGGGGKVEAAAQQARRQAWMSRRRLQHDKRRGGGSCRSKAEKEARDAEFFAQQKKQAAATLAAAATSMPLIRASAQRQRKDTAVARLLTRRLLLVSPIQDDYLL